MNDEQLTRLFRSLDEQAEPDAAFSDALFARLEREAHVGYRRRTSARWVLLAAALLVAAAVGAAAAIGSGLVKLPFELAVASATPEPSATPLGSGTPAPSPSASMTPTPSPSPAASAIVIDGLARSTVNGLRVRATAGTSGAQLGTIDTGQPGFVVAGPVSADGYAWYQLAGVGREGFLPNAPDCGPPAQTTPFVCPDWLGWVAAGPPGGKAWLEPTTLPCPASPMNLDALFKVPAPLASRTALERLACYGSSSIRVRGWFPEIPEGTVLGACGAVTNSSPAWMVCWDSQDNGLVVSESAGLDSALLKVMINPATGVTMPARGQWVEVVGHFDDPAAHDCVLANEGDVFGDVLTCRTEFVAESVNPVAGPY
jgi:hypothetical protein